MAAKSAEFCSDLLGTSTNVRNGVVTGRSNLLSYMSTGVAGLPTLFSIVDPWLCRARPVVR